MKLFLSTIFLLAILTSCGSTRAYVGPELREQSYGYAAQEPPITESLFADESATISEENIRKILDGSYRLEDTLRVAIVKLPDYGRRYYRTDETYLKAQQTYLDLFTESLQNSRRVSRVSSIPDLLLSGKPTFTKIRESAVRTQSDIVVVYSIASDVYSKYKLFTKTDIKAFATTQLIILDVRTGLIPFSTVVTRDFQSTRQESEINEGEAVDAIKNQAALLTIQQIGKELEAFLREN